MSPSRFGRSQKLDGEPVNDRFERFYREQFPPVARLARLLTGDAHAAEDLAQEAFLRVFRFAESSTRPIDNPAALLHVTALNVCRSWHTSRRRDERRMSRHGPDAVSLTEWERDLDDSLRRLPWEQRAVIVLRYWLGLTEAEIGQSLGCRPGTVRSRHFRALRALRKDLS